MDNNDTISFTKSVALLGGVGCLTLMRSKSVMKFFNKDIMFLLFRYIILNVVFIIIYYYVCNDERDWDYGRTGEYSNNKLFYSTYHAFMVSTTIGDIHPRSVKSRAITLVQTMCDFYLFGNIIYYLSYKEVNGF